MKKDSNLPTIVAILLFVTSVTMFSTLYHCPEWLYSLPSALTGGYVILAFVLLVASILIFIEITDF